MPDALAYCSQLEYQFRDPDIAALLAAAPASLARPLRSLCWMLQVSPPPIMAPPRHAEPAAAPEPPPLPPPPPPLPPSPAPAATPPACACGPPLSA